MDTKYLGKIIVLIGSKHRVACVWLFLYMLVGMFLETLGISLIIPALGTMMDPSSLRDFIPLDYVGVYLESLSPVEMMIGGIVLIITVYLIKVLFLGFLAFKQGKFIFSVQKSLSERLFSVYLAQPYTFHLQHNSAQLIRNITTEVAVFNSGLVGVLWVATEIITIIGIICLLMIVEPIGAVSVLLLLGVSSSIFYLMTKNYITELGKRREYHEGKRIQHIQQGLGGIKDVKVLGREMYFIKKYITHNQGSADVGQIQVFMQSLPRLWLEMLSVAAILSLFLSMVLQEKTTNEIIPILGVFSLAAFRMTPSVNKLITGLQNIRFTIPVVENLYKEVSLNGQNILKTCGNEIKKFYELVLKNISYKYPRSSIKVVKEFSIKISHGEMIGFVGASGAGKSTLIDLILGLLKPTYGQIEVNGVSIYENLRSWQNKIGYVPQNIYLSDDTLKNNVTFGVDDKDIDLDAVKKAICNAKLDDFVGQLEHGLDTIVGERGVRLSGGQRQRIGIARALYHDPEILVLDEATSSLDVKTEKFVMSAIDLLHGNKTIIVIAHRLSTVEACDRIYRMDYGHMVKEGSFREVIIDH